MTNVRPPQKPEILAMRKNYQHSMVIPTRNNAAMLRRCLAALMESARKTAAWEVLVIDNSDDDRKSETEAAVKEYGAADVRYAPMAPLGLMAARHRGAELAQGAIVSFLDDDAFVCEGWAQGVETAFRDPKVVLAVGPILPDYEVQPPDWINYFWEPAKNGRYLGYLSMLDLGPTQHIVSPSFVWGGNCFVRREIYLRVNGTNPDYLPPPWQLFQGDGEMALPIKVAALGHAAHYCPDCAVRHRTPASRFTRQHWNRRAFFMGLHRSFTQFRFESGLGPEQGVPPADKYSWRTTARKLRRCAGKTWVGDVRRRLLGSKAIAVPEEVARIRRTLTLCQEEGWRFHREGLACSAVLQEYDRRPHYMGANAALPRPQDCPEIADVNARLTWNVDMPSLSGSK
jgi:glycosyltransferase involved in cell wall biosynthesis